MKELGLFDNIFVGHNVGMDFVGWNLGLLVGSSVGFDVGISLLKTLGLFNNIFVGCNVGADVVGWNGVLLVSSFVGLSFGALAVGSLVVMNGIVDVEDDLIVVVWIFLH